MRSPAQVREFTVRQWIESAAADLEWAEMGAKSSEIRGIAQIGSMRSRPWRSCSRLSWPPTTSFPKTIHNIARLIAQVRLLDRATADAVSPAASLTPYAVHYRYPPRSPDTAHRLKREDVLRDLDIARAAIPVLQAAAERRLGRLREMEGGR